MRRKIALSALGAAVALSVAPLQPASAVCLDWYYDLTGTCSPCGTVGAAVRVVDKVTGEELVSMDCLA